MLIGCSKTSLAVNAAVDASQFKPDVSRRRQGRVTVVALSRLVYRKGIDLLVVIIPEMCYRHPQVDFVIGKAPAVMTRLALDQVLGGFIHLAGPCRISSWFLQHSVGLHVASGSSAHRSSAKCCVSQYI